MSRQILASGEKLVVSRPDATSGLSSFTWTCWLNPNGGFGSSTPGVLTKLGAEGAEKKRFRITASSLGRRFIGEVSRAGIGATSSSVNLTVEIGSWQHLAMTYSELDGVRLYRNGVEVTYSSRTTGAGATDADTGGDLVIGGTTNTLDGRIAEVGIWGRALSGAELGVLSGKRYSPLLVRPGLLAAWRLLGQVDPEPDSLGGPAAVPTGTVGAEHPPIVRSLLERSIALGQMRGQYRGMA